MLADVACVTNELYQTHKILRPESRGVALQHLHTSISEESDICIHSLNDLFALVSVNSTIPSRDCLRSGSSSQPVPANT